MAGASQRDGNPGASSQRQSLLRRLENREQLAAQTREQPTRPLAADSRGGTVPNQRKRSLEEALDDARHNKQQSTSRGDRERGRQKGDGQTKPVITHEFDHLVLNCKQDPRAVEVYIGRSSRGAARLDFRDCSWGNYLLLRVSHAFAGRTHPCRGRAAASRRPRSGRKLQLGRR